MSRLCRRTIGWMMMLVVAVSGLGLGADRPARAWGPQGHRIATRIAEGRLTPAAKAAVRDLLHQGDSLVEESNWADHDGHNAVPASAPWHFVNVPITAAHYEARFCVNGNCVVDKIKHFRKVLASPDTPKPERARALLFLVHFIEDVHQPLHVGDHHDRGGNLTQVQFLGQGDNLHRLWDSSMIIKVDRNERAWVERIEPLLTAKNVAAWSKGSVETWADESLQDAKKAYDYPPGSAAPIKSGTTLGHDYVELALPILRLRLAQAGVRLANELNAIFP